MLKHVKRLYKLARFKIIFFIEAAEVSALTLVQNLVFQLSVADFYFA